MKVKKEQKSFRSKEQRHKEILESSGNKYNKSNVDNNRLYKQVKKYHPHLLIKNQEIEELLKEEK